MKQYPPYLLITLLTVSIPSSLHAQNRDEESLTSLFKKYYKALQKNSDSKWKYTTDTVTVWFDTRAGEPNLQIKGAKSAGKWREWDQEMNARLYYDSIWTDAQENAIKGYFYENNDFYTLLGKPPTKTLRTYWFDSDKKINEILIYWIPEVNTTTSEYLKPIEAWAMKNDSLEFSQLYPDVKLVPSKENAMRWKVLLKKYNNSKNN